MLKNIPCHIKEREVSSTSSTSSNTANTAGSTSSITANTAGTASSINSLIISDATGRKFITILTTLTTPTTIPLGTSSIIKAEERVEKVGCDCVGIAEAPCRYSTPKVGTGG